MYTYMYTYMYDHVCMIMYVCFSKAICSTDGTIIQVRSSIPIAGHLFHFGSNGLPLFSVFSKREKDLNIYYIGGIIPLFHTCGGKLF